MREKDGCGGELEWGRGLKCKGQGGLKGEGCSHLRLWEGVYVRACVCFCDGVGVKVA